MKYIRRQSLNPGNILDDTVLQKADGNVEFNPTQRVVINGDLDIIGGAIPGPEVTNVMYVTLDGDDTNSGYGEGPNQAKRTLKSALEVADQGTTIFIRSGEYYEDNPLVVPPKVSIIGDNLRRVILRPLNGPVSHTITNIERTDQVTTITFDAPHSLSTADRIRVRCSSNDAVDETDVNISDVPADDQVSFRQLGDNIASEVATGIVLFGPDFFLVNSQNYVTGVVFKGLQAPAYCVNIDSDAIVDTSPYIQNCSNINGPWMNNGVEWLPFQTQQPNLSGAMVTGPRPLLDDEIDPTQVHIYGINVEGAGGGMLIDGDRYNALSPVKSMVGDAFTQVAQGAIGFHVSNFGYMQLVSCFAVFCSKAFYTSRGGYLSISNSVIDFGQEGFVAEGYYLDPYTKGEITTDYYSTVGSVTVNTEGSGFTVAPDITIEPPTTPGGTPAIAVASIDPILGRLNAISIIDPGSGYDFQPAVTITPANGATATANLSKNLNILVKKLANKPQVGSIMFLGNDPTAYYISGTTDNFVSFTYNETKCRRDAGYIIDGIYYDVAIGTNYNAIVNGRSYQRAMASEVIDSQLTETVGAINFLKSAAQVSLVSDSTAVTRSNAAFTEIIDIIENGEVAADVILLPAPTGGNPDKFSAKEQLRNNRNFLRYEVTNWIDNNYVITYDHVLCARDIGYIVDALCYDVLYGGNSATIVAAAAYFEGAASVLPPEQRPIMSAALTHLGGVVAQVVQEFVVTKSAGNLEDQDFSGVPATATEANALVALVQIITDVIDANSLGGLPAAINPNVTWASAGIQTAIGQLVDDKLATIDNMIDFINNEYVAPFKYDEQKCRRDIGYIIDAACSDAVLNSNHQSVYAGLAYLRSYSSKVTSRQKQQTIAGIGKARDEAVALTGDTTMQSRIIDACNVVINIITIGLAVVPPITIPPTATRDPGFAEAAAILVANKTFIQDELEAWIELNYPLLSYNVSKCRRDIGYITDAMAYDLTYEGNTQSVNAALAYVEGSVIAGQVEETQQAYEYWQTIVGSIVKNIPIVRTTGNTTTQNTSLSIGAPVDPNAPALTAQALLQITIDVIDNGTGYIPDPVSKPNFDNGDPLLNIERTSILADIATVQDNTIDYLNDLYGGQITISVFPSIQNVSAGTVARLHNVSTTSSGATAMEYVGSGITYNALPFYGGEPDPTQEKVERNNGKCFVVTSDQVGNYRIGAFFTVNAITGEVTIDAEKLNLSGLASIGPFKRNGIPVGVQLREVSNNPNLIASTGAQDGNTAPTQQAVSTYVENRYLNKVAIGAQTVESDVSFVRDVQIRGGDLTTNQTTFNLLNDVAETVNFAGAATEINIGDTTGTTTVNNNLAIGGAVISAPQPVIDLVNTFTNTINFGGEAHTINIGADAGTLTINNATVTFANAEQVNVDGPNPTISSTSTGTLTFFNTAITEVDAFGAATSINIGASGTGTTSIKHNLDVDGDVNIDGGDLTVSTTTFNLANTTATTVNAFGAATTLGIGGGSGTTTINNSLQVSNSTTLGSDTSAVNVFKGTATFNLPDNISSAVDFREATNTYIKFDTTNGLELVTVGALPRTTFLNTIDASNATDAAVTFAGGVGISKQLYIETNLFVNGNATLGNSRLTDTHTVEGTLSVNVPDDTSVAFRVKENTQSYITAVTTNGAESVSIGTTPKLLVENVTDSFSSTQGALIVEGGAAVKKNLTVGVDLQVDRDITATGDLSVNGGDFNTNSASFNILNATVTTINFGSAATAINIGAVTGTTTINNANTVITGDLQVKGGDLTTNQTAFNLLNTTATNINFAGAATTLTIGSAVGTTNINNELTVDASAKINAATDGQVEINSSSIEIGLQSRAVAGSSYIDFHSATAGADYDSRIIATGGTVSSGEGNLSIYAATTTFEGNAVATGNITATQNLIATGDLAVNGGDLTTSQTAFNLLNTTATDINFGGAGTNIVIGALTGTTRVRNAEFDVSGRLYVGLQATATRFPNAQAVISETVIGIQQSENHNIGLIAEGTADSSNSTIYGIGVYGVGYTAGATRSGGVVGEGHVSASGDSGSAIGVRGYANDTHAGGLNIGLYGDAANAASNYALAMNNGNILSNFAQTWTLADNQANALSFDTAGKTGVLVITTTNGSEEISTTGNLTVTGDAAVNGGDITSSATTFNLLNTNVLTGNIFGVATAVNAAASAASASTLTYGPAISGNTIKLAGTASGTVNYTTDVTSGTVNAWQSVTGIVNVSNSGVINLGTSTTATTTATVGGAYSGNTLKIASTAGGTVNITTDVTSGVANIFNSVSTGGTVNFATGSDVTINVGGSNSTVNIQELTLVTDLEVQYGGTGQSSFTTNGVIYGNNTSGLLVTAASVPGSNATTSYGILTTDLFNVPVWTDTIDGGSY
jgi:hypothetical protein